ncbi:MAG: Asp-tRNA(Asn)/Glu-tRNA(Gln) amidotransferase subunit GatC [Ignavibacteriaceae bacterium]|nr:Asp-tRNA(Asn)/Glu-tRNA(Gln) amidotransferase subunit GatC [Ignavibacteriaceae bacterium]
MAVTFKEVEQIAKLARLKFSEEELSGYTTHLNQILAYIEKLNELDTESIKALSHPIENENVFRDDITKDSLSTSDALKNSPQKDDQFFKVPRVI